MTRQRNTRAAEPTQAPEPVVESEVISLIGNVGLVDDLDEIGARITRQGDLRPVRPDAHLSHIATLIRGKVYKIAYAPAALEFRQNVPVRISEREFLYLRDIANPITYVDNDGGFETRSEKFRRKFEFKLDETGEKIDLPEIPDREITELVER